MFASVPFVNAHIHLAQRGKHNKQTHTCTQNSQISRKRATERERERGREELLSRQDGRCEIDLDEKIALNGGTEELS